MDRNKRTFKINTTCRGFLEKLLIERGWKNVTADEEIDFSYYDTYLHEKIKDAKVMVIPRNITNQIDNKKSMYNILKNDLINVFPKTYTDLKNIDSNIFDGNKIFFLKKHAGSGNKDVHVIQNFVEFNNICNEQYSHFILQEEVPNMFLYDDKYKCVIRSYGLIHNNNNYIYNDSKFDIYKNEYSKRNMSNSIHNDEYNSVRHEKLTDMPFNDKVFLQIKSICKKINVVFEKFDSTDKFIILGYDFILDKNLKPYLIEVNGYPNLVVSKDQAIKSRMLEDFTELVVFNNYTNENGFVDVNTHDNEHKKVYILGGFGSLAGIDISKKLLVNYSKMTSINIDSDNIPFVLDSESNNSELNETKISTYNNFIDGMMRVEKYYETNNMSKLIVGVGCNTMHLCLENYKVKGNINIVNMIECVCNKVNKIYRNYQKIYLLSSYETFTSNMYHEKLECKIEDNADLFTLVKELYVNIKTNKTNNENICSKILNLITNNSLIILGCTELPIDLDTLIKYSVGKKIDFVDCNHELAKQLCFSYMNSSFDVIV